MRSYEAEYVNGLWHWDCHHGSRKVLTARGEWQTPILFGVLDDRSRLACHLQWYVAETAEIIAHGLSQLTHPLIYANPKVSLKTLFSFMNSSYLTRSGRNLFSGMVGMRS